MKVLILSLVLGFQFLFASDFSQEVSYKIDAELIPSEKILKVKSLMNYKNNSPDELREIYVHIYWNLYAKNSYARKLAKSQKDYYSQVTKDVVIKKVVLKQNDRERVDDYLLDNTVMKIPLITPLKPGQSIDLEIELEEEIPEEGYRMGYYKRYFSIAHWFPAVCVYDKFGWHKDQYLGNGEFFEEIADFEVNITLPKTYLVFSTGEVVNKEEVYTPEILRKLNEAKNSTYPVRIFEPKEKIEINDGESKTWKIIAQNVRTFAFSAFEDYLWDAASIGNVLVHVVYPKSLESFYSTEGIKASLHAIKFFSERIGPYVYPQMFVTVGGAGGGMEYPGIVFMGRSLIGGLMARTTASVIIHEICHNWFPMMLNSNEVEHAFLDEGFTTFFTTLAMEELYGRYNNFAKLDGWIAKLIDNTDIRTNDYGEVISYQLTGYNEPIITHSDRYEQTYAYYVNSYSKAALVLFMLQYIMGDDAFNELWRVYYTNFLFKKIYPEDFFNLAEEIYQKYHGRKSLRWFFDQWFYKYYKLDLALKKFKYEVKDGKYITKIGIKNLERAVMPCDVIIEMENGQKETIWFDVDDFTKGSSYAQKTIELTSKPIRAEINPDKRLLDVNPLNNSSDFLPPIYFSAKPFSGIIQRPFHYSISFLQSFWFNDIDKFKIGAGVTGRYLSNQKFFEFNFSQGLSLKKGSTGGDITLGDRLSYFGPLAYGSIKYFNLEGRRGFRIKVDKEFARYYNRNPKFSLSISANYFDAYDDKYFDKDRFDKIEYFSQSIYDWQISMNRKFLFLNLDFTYKNNWEFFSTDFHMNYQAGVVRKKLETYSYLQNPTLTITEYSNVQYQKLSISFLQNIKPRSIVSSIKFRQYVGVTPNKLPKATEFYLATVTPIEEFDLPLYRTYGILSRNFRENHSVPNGGGYMRSYFKNNLSDDLITVLNTEVNLGKTFSYLGPVGKFIGFFSPSFFFDFGNVWANNKEINMKAFKYGWGFSISLIPDFSIPLERVLSQINPLSKIGIKTIRFDFPLYVSHPPAGENKFQFRWLVGFSKVM